MEFFESPEITEPIKITQKYLFEKSRSICNIDKRGYEKPFGSNWLSDLFLSRYWYCHDNNLRPECFMWKYGQYLPDSPLVNIFHTKLPGIEWRKISFNKAVKGLTKEESISDNIDSQFRNIGIRYYPPLEGKCEKCKLKIAQHVHHLNPTFSEIYNKCIKLILKSDINRYDFLSMQELLPTGHPSLILCSQEHSKAVYLKVCQDCHKLYPKVKKDKIFSKED
jgi:hypothetical protein